MSRLGQTSYASVTGVPVNFTLLGLAAFALQRQQLLLDPLPPSADRGYDALLASPTAFGDAAQVTGKLLDLSYVVQGDKLLDWPGVQAHVKATVMYDGSTVALPLIPAPQMMYYHLGIFRRDNLSVPQTWEEFTDLAERYHGRDGMMGACIMAAGCRSESFTLRMIYGSYVQTEGQSQGMYWDSNTLEPLVNSPAMEAALKIFRRLRAVGPNVTVPASCLRREYVRGKCLLSVNAGTEFKVGQLTNGSTVMRGLMGMALMPGSTHVLDRGRRVLVPCNTTMCPLAVGTTVVDGVELPVNRPITSSVNIVLLNGLSPPVYQFYVYNLFSYLASPAVIGTKGLLTALNEILPIRAEDLELSNVPHWVAAGYERDDVVRFLTVYNQMTSLTNINADLKIRLTTNVTNALLDAALAYNNASLGADVRDVMRGLEAALAAIVEAEGGVETFKQQYRRSLNWSPPPQPEAPAPPPAPSKGRAVVPLAVGIPCGVVTALAAAALLLVAAVRRHRGGKRTPSAPGVGSATTLCVTDIQDSTVLWEALPAEHMDAALKLHHRVIRELLLTHNGYESATEGDSFILAFHGPLDALLFAVDAQQALLEAAWPPGLLCHPPLPGVEHHNDPAAEVIVLRRPPARQNKSLGHPRKVSGVSIASPRVNLLFTGRSGEAPNTGTDLQTAGSATATAGSLLTAAPTALQLTHSDSQSLRYPAAAALPVAASTPLPPGSLPARTPRFSLDIGLSAPRTASLGDAAAAAAGGAGGSCGERAANALRPSRHAARMSGLAAYLRRPRLAARDSHSGAGAGSERHTASPRTSHAPMTARLQHEGGEAGSLGGYFAVGSMEESPAFDVAAAAHSESLPSSVDLGLSGHGSPFLAGVSPPMATVFGAAAGAFRAAAVVRTSPAGVAAPAGTAAISSTGMALPSRARLSDTDCAQAGNSSALRPLQEGSHARVNGSIAAATGRGLALATLTAGRYARTPASNHTVSMDGTTAASLRSCDSALAGTQPFTAVLRGRPSTDRRPSLPQGPVPESCPDSHDLELLPRPMSADGVSEDFGILMTPAAPTLGSWLQSQYRVQSSAAQAVPAFGRLSAPASGQASPVGAGSLQSGVAGRSPSVGAVGSGGSATKGREAAVVVFRGLRVRMGLHSGVVSPGDVTRNTASGRMTYSGYPLRIAKAVSDAAHGGMILLSETAREELLQDDAAPKALQSLLLLWAGRHVLANELPHMHLFQACPRGLIGRLALQAPLRTKSLIPPFTGALAAPVQYGALARVSVVGAGTLLAWDYPLARQALELLHEALAEELKGLGGGGRAAPYIVEGALGLTGRSRPKGRPSADARSSASATPPDRLHLVAATAATDAVLTGASAGAAGLMGQEPQDLVSGPAALGVTFATLSSGGGGASDRLPQFRFGGLGGQAAKRHEIASDAGNARWPWNSAPLASNWEAEPPNSSDLVATTGKLAKVHSWRTGSLPRSATTDLRRSHKPNLKPSLGSAAAALLGTEGGGGRQSPGVMTVVFDNPWAAAAWLLRAADMMPHLDWPPELLQHPLCEEVAFEHTVVVGSLDSDVDMTRLRLQRKAAARDSPQRGRAPAGAVAAAASPLGPASPPSALSPPLPSPHQNAPWLGGLLRPSRSSGLQHRSGLLFRGLRARCVCVFGELGGELPAGFSGSGQLAYRGKAWAALGKLAAKAKAGEVATNVATLAMLPPAVAKLVVPKNT